MLGKILGGYICIILMLIPLVLYPPNPHWVIMILVFSILYTVFIALHFTHKMEKLNSIFEQISKGDFGQKDVGDMGKLTKNLNSMIRGLFELKRKRDLFFGMAAHDLRNPLSNIMEASHLLSSKKFGELNPKQMRLVDLTYRASKSMIELLNEVLQLNTFDSKGLQIVKRKVNLLKFGEDLFEFNKLNADKKNLIFKLDLQIHQEWGYFDEEKILQVINNFLSNAFKFSKSGSPILLIIGCDKELMRVEVQDEAGGIPPQEKSKVFQKFSKISVKPTGGESTNGLGLAICQDIIKAHKGTIGFHSTSGVGTIFYFEIDVSQSSAPTINADKFFYQVD